jgi:hypothetical protein
MSDEDMKNNEKKSRITNQDIILIIPSGGVNLVQNLNVQLHSVYCFANHFGGFLFLLVLPNIQSRFQTQVRFIPISKKGLTNVSWN